MDQPTEAELKVIRDQEFMKKLKVAVSAKGPLHEDDEYSLSEFTNDDDERRFREQDVSRQLKKKLRQLRKKADREEQRFGGKIILWSFDELKKGKKTMKQKQEEQVEKEKNAKLVAEKEAKATPKKVEKKVEKKTEKKVEKKVEKKDAKKETKKKETKEKKKRGPKIADGTITLLVKTNPKREGSKAHKRYELYKKHKSVAAYLEAGGKRSSLRYDERHKYIKLSNVKQTEKE